MKSAKNVLAVVLAILLAACLFAYYSTTSSNPAAAPEAAAAQQLVDTSLLQTAISLASSAATPDEQSQAREAWRLADHELDLSFAHALRRAETEMAAATPTTGPQKELADRIAILQARVEAGKKHIADLAASAGEDLDRAKAQLDLDQDALDDAQQDLARAEGDKRARLQRLLQEHQDSEKIADQGLKFAAAEPTATALNQLHAWLAVRQYTARLGTARRQAASHAQTLLNRHNALERQTPAQQSADASTTRLRALAGEHKQLAGLDQRIEDSKQLASVYGRWEELAAARQRADLHLLLRSLALILVILLVAVLLYRAARAAFRRTDRRRTHQLRMIAGITVQVVALVLILLVLFGPPTQLSTVLGLITAGITVVLKDFIVAFLGWFALMGRNGISVGDWVEIEGVSGEVIEIGFFKTVLLELGNGGAGHPTGRRVAFSNSFAMAGHYFNFTTAGQWLWDDLQITLPVREDPYDTAHRIQEIVEAATQADAAEAAQEWQRSSHSLTAREFSAAPTVNLRPGLNGFDVDVRYITRAPQRHAVKAKILHDVVDLLHASH